jgi:hypothetical protein
MFLANGLGFKDNSVDAVRSVEFTSEGTSYIDDLSVTAEGVDIDTDSDNLVDLDELKFYGTSITDPDSDDDHALSLNEIYDLIPSPVLITESGGSTQVSEAGPGSDTGPCPVPGHDAVRLQPHVAVERPARSFGPRRNEFTVDRLLRHGLRDDPRDVGGRGYRTRLVA